MTFTTREFLVFMSVVFCVYYIVPKRFQWIVLLFANTYFYYCSGWVGMLFFAGVIALSYGAGLWIEKTGKKGIAIGASVGMAVLLLAVMRLPFASRIMPLGLSFYTLQCIGYCIEVYRKSTRAERNPAKYALYISYFPHVLQGPFEDFGELYPQLFKEHTFDYERTVYGFYRFAWGLMKKMVLADRIGYILEPVYGDVTGYHGMTVWFAMLLYSVQLYADFSGYMDMAVGCSEMLGIGIRENFNVPYGSKSMTEFWRRWHMSLGLWFKNYVFYPVLRTKICMSIQKKMKAEKKKYLMKVIPTTIALTVNWTLIGLWHGFDLNYLCYDWFCGLLIILAEIMKPVYTGVNKKFSKVFESKWMDGLRVIRTYLVVSFSFLFFRPDTISDSAVLIRNLFTKPDFVRFAEFIYWDLYDIFLILIPMLLLAVVDGMKYCGKDVFKKVHSLPAPVRWAIYVAGILLIYITKGDRSGTGFAYYVF